VLFNLKICIFAIPNYFYMTDTKNTIAARLAALREEMQREGLSAFIFPSADPHMSEYVPKRWEGRKWISGFDGSAGTAV
jgi:Xaa-Pro aminopeptidase